jgi:hypothetical protein
VLFAVVTARDLSQTPLSSPSGSTPAPAEPPPLVSIGGWSWRQEDGYAIAEGQVTSLFPHALEDVEAVVTFSSKDGEFITSRSAPIQFNPILPGQTSSWRVAADWNPSIASASLRFEIFGTPLPAEQEE